ncbi:MAG: hypothetical protein K6E29_03625 [Cyanobacteria bacterium RUI128]|nr:hypothetical protein [Cyanobacteria bacterium RUI128]
MKQYLVSIFWILLLGAAIYLGYGQVAQINAAVSEEVFPMVMKSAFYAFLAGASLTALIFDAMTSGTAESLNMYKRELEKESIDKTENSSRVKVLESKIEVLEKALDEALKK